MIILKYILTPASTDWKIRQKERSIRDALATEI
jgi:hypothetical protein